MPPPPKNETVDQSGSAATRSSSRSRRQSGVPGNAHSRVSCCMVGSSEMKCWRSSSIVCRSWKSNPATQPAIVEIPRRCSSLNRDRISRPFRLA